MTSPKWILKDVVLSIHYEQIREHGGVKGTRSIPLLESAINRPKNKWLYNDKGSISLLSLGAIYCYGLVKNHPFFDGNKRTALVTMLVFLKKNGIEISATNQERFLLMMKVAQNQMSEQQITCWLQEYSGQKILLDTSTKKL